MFLPTPTTTLQLLLGGAVATNELPFAVSWADVVAATFEADAIGTSHGESAGAGGVTMVSGAAADLRRQIKRFWVYNADTAEVTVIIRLNFNGTTRVVRKVTLRVGATLEWTEAGGFEVHETSSGDRLPVPYPLGGNTHIGRTSADWVRVRGAKIVRLNGALVKSAVADLQLLTTDAGTSVTLRVYNITEDEVAGTSAPCTDTDDEFGEPDQRQRIALTIQPTECDYVLEQQGSNADSDALGFGHIEAIPI